MTRTMKLSLLAGLAAAAISTPAFAQDTPEKEFDGVYVGGSVGYDVQGNDVNEKVLFDRNLDGARFDDSVLTAGGANAFAPGFCNGLALSSIPTDGCRNDRDDLSYSGRIGFDKQMGRLVLGVVGDVGSTNIRDSVSAFSITPANYVFTREIDYVASIRGRVGYAANRTLFYVTGGPGYAGIKRSFTTTNGTNSFTARNDDAKFGFLVGGGIEQKVSKHISFGLEYMYNQFNDNDYRVRVGPGTSPVTSPFRTVNANGTDLRRSDGDFRWHSLRATIAYRF